MTTGELVEVLDLSADERFALLRDGPRGAPDLPAARPGHGHVARGAALSRPQDRPSSGMLRPPPSGEPAAFVAYVVTDAGQARGALVAVPFDAAGSAVRGRGHRRPPRRRARVRRRLRRRVPCAGGLERRGPERARAAGHRHRLTPALSRPPRQVVRGGVVARDGHRAVLAVEGPSSPSRLWELELDTGCWRSLTPSTVDEELLVTPTLERFESHDGLDITGWLYRPEGADASSPAVVSLHGGPESQERPGFHADHQLLAAMGFVVLRPQHPGIVRIRSVLRARR